MRVTTKLNDAIKSSRRRMQAGQSPSVVKSEQQTGATNPPKKQQVERTSTEQQKYTDG